MSSPFYVAPEQQMKDRADFARKGIGRGRSVVVLHYADGIVFVAENRSQALHKVGEIYDRIGFAAVGRYNEFDTLRQAGIRYADLRGYSYDRTDVTARGLANAYAQLLGGMRNRLSVALNWGWGLVSRHPAAPLVTQLAKDRPTALQSDTTS